jgi:small subunit ribosomal protein S1
MKVASLDSVASQMEAAGVDKEDDYRRFEELLGSADVSFNQGDRVTGTIFRVDNRGAYVDVGGKSAAFCPTSELSLAPVSRAEDVVSAGQAREFYVIRGEGYGELTLSIKQLEGEVVWEKLREMMASEATVTAPVVAVNRGGVLVDVQGIRAFCPGSQLSRRVPNFEQLIGTEMEFKIIEADAEKNRLMLSNKRAVTSDAAASYNVGDVVEGVVMSVKPYGAFIDLGGMSGLLHISQISHDRVMDVEKVLNVGDSIKVMVLSQDQKRGRVGLCTKKLEPTPGDMLRDPALVYEKAEEMAALFKQRVADAEAAAAGEEAQE